MLECKYAPCLEYFAIFWKKKKSHTSTTLMCDMEQRCQYKQRVVRKNRSTERGSSHSCHQVVSVSMSELFLTWLPLWSSCLSRMEELQLLVKDQLSQDWTQTPTWSRRLRRCLWTLWTRSLLSLSPLYLRQIMTNYWWVKKGTTCLFYIIFWYMLFF